MRPRPHLPAASLPFLLGATAITFTLVAWAVFDARPTGTGFTNGDVTTVDPDRLRAVAYMVPEDGGDTIYIRDASGIGQPRVLARFPGTFTLHARGSASPDGDTIAVLSVDGPGAAGARLTLLQVATGEAIVFAGPYDNLSTFAWSGDGNRLALVSSSRPDEFGRVTAAVSEVDVSRGTAAEVARFEDVFQAAPVGYSIDRARLFVVVVDRAGSSLWAVEGGSSRPVARLSAGKTRDWRLSPDGARLAYIEVMGAGDVAYAGRVLTLATGAIRVVPGDGDQFGTAWRPGSDVPAFGGPGGTLAIHGTNHDGYVVPLAWSPDGGALVASVVVRVEGDHRPSTESLEIVTEQARTLLSTAAGGRFIGWVLSDAAAVSSEVNPWP